jgi:hypothetical protein
MTTNDYIALNAKIEQITTLEAKHQMVKRLALIAANLRQWDLFRELDAEYLKIGSEIFWKNDKAAQEKEVA